MKKLNSFLIVIMLFFTAKVFAQGMQPPAPVNSPFVDAAIGTWVSEPYEMMGMKMTDRITHSKILNGQFMEIDITGKGETGFVYESKGIVAPSSDGTMTGWFFDIFGKDGISNYTGMCNGTSVDLNGTGNWGTETRKITIDGDSMTHDISFSMKDPSGKMMPEQKMTIKYKKIK